MLNCVIIDDEQFSIDAHLKYINLLKSVNVLGCYTDPLLALENISIDDGIDLILMDIDMPSISGIELAKELRPKTQRLVFATAHSKYALDAFEVEADAFLLKPFSFGKFLVTINRLFPNESTIMTPGLNSKGDYFMVKNKDEDLRITKVSYKEIIAFESYHNHMKIHLVDGDILTVYLTIRDVLELVGHRENFKQFHRAFVICTDYISYIDGNRITMTNKSWFNVGKNFKDRFVTFLSVKLIKTARR